MVKMHKGDQLTLDHPLDRCVVELTVPPDSELRPVILGFVGRTCVDFRLDYNFNITRKDHRNRSVFSITAKKPYKGTLFISQFLFAVCKRSDVLWGVKPSVVEPTLHIPVEFSVRAHKLRVDGTTLIGDLPARALDLGREGSGGLWRLAVSQSSKDDNRLIEGVRLMSM